MVQTIMFTATHEMAEYVCEAHPGSMRGDITIGDQQTSTPTHSQPDKRFMPWGATIGTKTVADGSLSAPVDFEVVPDDTDRWCIVDQVGQIYVHTADGLQNKPFLDIADRLIDFGQVEEGTIDERGFLGLAFHPQFQDNRKFYVRYSAPARPKTPKGYTHIERLSEFTADQNRQHGRPASERIILDIPSPHHTHNAGSVIFGPDEYLYMGMGDGGGSKLETGHTDDWFENNGGNGQDVTDNLLGSILRIDINNRASGKQYAIPDDNPLVGKPGRGEHYAWGFRNPWRMSFNDGQLFVADVGESNYEEVNIVEKGKNYGWNVREGFHCYSTDDPQNPPEKCPQRTPPNVRGGEPLIDPIIEYPHVYEDESVGLSVIGGYKCEDETMADLQGKYVFGDYSKDGQPRGSLFAATPSPDAKKETTGGDENKSWELEELQIASSNTNELDSYVLGFGRDDAGQLYVLTTKVLGVDPTTTSGQVQQLVSNTAGEQTQDEAGSNVGGPGFGILAALGGGLIAGLIRALSSIRE
ncbi:PQQ-dependent sugar dehydrogenase [Halococcus sediminicola]|uniref:PQQ-dependent sugar dehydrogenase n=1 Tax=Halococcus sediminicola TaxID=1264579 RepID=UPI000679A398|nr:PQQ-dependent sugar dehydrogenase [Halococcus sediminicola]